MSLFSGPNNPRDVTLDPQYATVCSYTDIDPDQVFAPETVGLGAGWAHEQSAFVFV